MRRLNDYFVYGHIADVSTAGQIYIPIPDGGEVVKIISALNGTIATADATLTAKIGGTAVTGGSITIAYSGSAAGDVDTCEPTAARSVDEGGTLEIETSGASTNTVAVTICAVIRR